MTGNGKRDGSDRFKKQGDYNTLIHYSQAPSVTILSRSKYLSEYSGAADRRFSIALVFWKTWRPFSLENCRLGLELCSQRETMVSVFLQIYGIFVLQNRWLLLGTAKLRDKHFSGGNELNSFGPSSDTKFYMWVSFKSINVRKSATL